jgi:hypothetical protein
MEDRRYYAMALDRDKHQADAIASNAGHCLWSGIVTPDRAGDVVDRLLRPEMFSGWGVRTFASDQPGYNPIGYHTGTVWPHDTSLIAAGFKRYGFTMRRTAGRPDDGGGPEASRITACPSCSAASTGPTRTRRAVPVRLLAAGVGGRSSFLFLETMLGLRAHADRDELELLPPHLPDWLGKVTLTDLRSRGRVGRPAVPPLARVRPAPRSCARSATSPSPSDSDAPA